jgi:hypothetical protein
VLNPDAARSEPITNPTWSVGFDRADSVGPRDGQSSKFWSSSFIGSTFSGP